MKKALLITAGLIWAAATLPFTALTGPAHADTLSGGKADIDAWITTLGGITLSNQPVPSDFPTDSRRPSRSCRARARPMSPRPKPISTSRSTNSSLPQGEDRLRPKHRMPSRPRKDRRPRKAGPVDDRRPGVDQRLQGLQAVGGQAQGKARGKGSAIAGVHGGWEKWADYCAAHGNAVSCCSTLRTQEAACQRAILTSEKSNCDQAERWCQSTMKR